MTSLVCAIVGCRLAVRRSSDVRERRTSSMARDEESMACWSDSAAARADFDGPVVVVVLPPPPPPQPLKASSPIVMHTDENQRPATMPRTTTPWPMRPSRQLDELAAFVTQSSKGPPARNIPEVTSPRGSLSARAAPDCVALFPE